MLAMLYSRIFSRGGVVVVFIFDEDVVAVARRPGLMDAEARRANAVDRVERSGVGVVGQGVLVVDDQPAAPVGDEYPIADHRYIMGEDAAARVRAARSARSRHLRQVADVQHDDFVARTPASADMVSQA